MKIFSSLVIVLLAALNAASPAVAQQHDRRFAQGGSAGEMRRPFFVQRNDQKAEQQSPREPSADQQAKEPAPAQEQGQGPAQGRERLSPEERRQLRRDINAAGRDIYRRNKPE